MKTAIKIKTVLLMAATLAFPFALRAQDVSHVIETGTFSGIDVGGTVKVELTQGEGYFVEVTTNGQDIDKVEARVRNGVLQLTYTGSTRNAQVSARITTPEINLINLSGVAHLTGQNEINTEALKIRLSGASNANIVVNTPSIESSISGAGNLTLAGKAGHHRADLGGAAQLKAQQLLTQTTEIRASGASNARITVMELLYADASGTSRIGYDSEPASKQIKVSGVGNVTNLSAGGASSLSDTTRLSLGNREMLIIGEDQNIRVQTRRKKKFRNNWAGFEMGINGYLAPGFRINLQEEAEPIDLRYERSFVYNLNLFQQNFRLIDDNLGLVTGLGFTFNNYRFDNQTRIMQDRQGVFFVEDDENNIIRNKLNVDYFNVPLLLEFQTHGNKDASRFHMAGGVIMGARIATNARYVVDNNGKKRREKDYKDFHIHPFKLDITGRIGWGKINLFATYSLNSLFKEGKGPELYPFAVGLRLVSF